MSPTAADRPAPFVETSPGDLITAQLMNDVQVLTREEIARKVAEGVAGVKEVDRARDSAKLEGRTAQELADEIVRRAMAALPSRTGYKVVYKRLHPGEPASIRHDLAAYPLVDVYQLASFPAVVSADEVQSVENVHWYLYHRTEMKIRHPKPGDSDPRLVTIEESRGPVFKHTFQSMLDLYGVRFTEQSALGDVVNEFWKALFKDPNDQFDETAYANSPWFDRCCGDRRTVESLKRGGEWNDLFLKVMPIKTLNTLEPRAPLPVLVEHYNLFEVGLWWLAGADEEGGNDGPSAAPQEDQDAVKADVRRTLVNSSGSAFESRSRTASAGPTLTQAAQETLKERFLGQVGDDGDAGVQRDELRVMVLLKV